MTNNQLGSHEISELLSKNLKDSPLKEVFTNFELRQKYQLALNQALDLTGFSHFSNDIFIGEMNDKGMIRLFTRQASIISRLKNKLPSLLHCFRESGFPVKEIQLKVLPKSNLEPENTCQEETKPDPIALSASQFQSWENLLRATDPESPTYQAIELLLFNAKKVANKSA
ncbi:hypothetical protein [Polynucleobacter rarus]|uniref:hypothetical protein n=1 Tax=Polynucleobacter rarus TaxID=556055 RepID=UPI000D3E74A2|nr:hypothetical protein [Polynucleobacter rarus]